MENLPATLPHSEPQVVDWKIMLVDDNEALLDVLREALAHHGVSVSTYSSATEALAAMSTITPDCIVCDIVMPGMDGHEFHERVRSSLEWTNIPFIFLTALAGPDDRRSAKESGCDDFLTKPVDPLELLAVIRGKLSRARERESLVENRLDSYRRRIVHTLSHEFRTPLVAINTGTEILLEQYDTLEPSRILHLIASIKRSGQRLQRLVDDFMLLQQIDSGVARTAFERLHTAHSLNEIAQSAVDLFEETLEPDTSKITLHLAPAGTSVVADIYDVQVIDVVRRLLSNAHKFGAASEVISVKVVAGEECLGDGGVPTPYCGIAVQDSGPGMSDHAIKQVCRRFTQINRERMEQQGCGLGLSIADYFSRLNKGRLVFERPPEGGLRVEVRFRALHPKGI